MDNKNKSFLSNSFSAFHIPFGSSIPDSLIKLGAVLCLSSMASMASADWLKQEKAHSLMESLEKGKTHLDFRLRYEDANSGDQGAQALTLRSRLAFETLPYELFSAFVEFDDVRAIPSDENYNSGSNGQLDDLFIEDPEGTELNQAWLVYDIANTFIKFGRQSISLNNERMLGGDAWRQNEQTFTGLSIQNETLNYIRIQFAQLNHVQTNQDKSLSSAHQDINAKLLNLNYRGFWLNDLSFYALWIRDHTESQQWETSTYGLRFSGDLGGDFSIAYQLEYAQQEDAGANSANYSVGYSLVDLLFGYNGVRVKVGYERLGASKDGFFVTPLGSLQSFQGASGQFANNGLGSIQSGIQDSYLGLGYELDLDVCQTKFPVSVSATYHDFDVDSSSDNLSHLGEEWVIKASIEMEHYQILVQFADFHADQFATDDRHLWLSLGMSF